MFPWNSYNGYTMSCWRFPKEVGLTMLKPYGVRCLFFKLRCSGFLLDLPQSHKFDLNWIACKVSKSLLIYDKHVALCLICTGQNRDRRSLVNFQCASVANPKLFSFYVTRLLPPGAQLSGDTWTTWARTENPYNRRGLIDCVGVFINYCTVEIFYYFSCTSVIYSFSFYLCTLHWNLLNVLRRFCK